MLNNFIYAKTKDLFLEQLGAGNILDEAIVFIEDTKEIWNHGTYFGRESDFDADVFAALQQAVLDLQNETADINTDLDKKLDKTTAESTYATISQVNTINQNVEHLNSVVVENDAQVLSDAKSYTDDKEIALREDLVLMQASIDSKLDISTANNTYATKGAINSKQDELISGQNIKTLNGISILGTGDIVIDTSVLDSLGDSSERPLSQKAATDAINSEIERATEVETNLLTRIESHEEITQQAAQDASEANAYAQTAYTQSTEAINTANVAKNAVATLEGLANTDTAQQTLATTVTKIEQNTSDIQVLKEKFVVLSETEYTAIELKDSNKIYFIYEE